ncbi:MAG: hypothetical protein H7Z43_00130, partial [Clostridia bacterium]|nr:hypothetical protein [Deltaproteobacteria bacterium]
AGITPNELNAIYETAAARMDLGRAGEAARMLGALVVLYPFGADYWRAYALALQTLGDMDGARRATAMTLLITPVAEVERTVTIVGPERTAPTIIDAEHTSPTITTQRPSAAAVFATWPPTDDADQIDRSRMEPTVTSIVDSYRTVPVEDDARIEKRMQARAEAGFNPNDENMTAIIRRRIGLPMNDA